jgi:hypothetical protein
MNKHFHNLLAIMDSAETVPDEIKFTEKKDIYITSDLPMCPSFIDSVVNYCQSHNLRHTAANYPVPFILILNPNNP